MALGLVTNNEFDAELSKLTTSRAPDERVVLIERGRGPKAETPSVIRELIASEAIAGASAQELSEAFNVSKSSVSAYKNNATSTSSYNRADESIKNATDKVKTELGTRAQDKLRAALDSIVFPRDIKPQVASAIARDMSGVIKNLNPSPDVQINNQQVIVYKPRMRDEDSYETLQVIDN